MKYYKIALKKRPVGLLYPTNYQRDIGDKAASSDAHVYYTDEQDNPFLLIAIKDDDAVGIVRERVEQISEAELRTLCDQYEAAPLRFSDEAEIERIKIKVLRGQSLTENEEKALDPDDETVPGFTRRKRMYDRIAGIKAAEHTP